MEHSDSVVRRHSDRPLVRRSDFEDWSGYEAKLEMKELIDGRRRFRGVLEGMEDGEVRIDVDLGKDGRHVLGLPLALVGEARLVLTEDLVRESLRRAKQARRQEGAETTEDAASGSAGTAPAKPAFEHKPREPRRGRKKGPGRFAKGGRNDTTGSRGTDG